MLGPRRRRTPHPPAPAPAECPPGSHGLLGPRPEDVQPQIGPSPKTVGMLGPRRRRTAPPGPAPVSCPGPGTTERVFHIMDGGTSGLAEKNAASAHYDLYFIAGPASGVCEEYWPNGVIEMATVRTDQWQAYERCNHPPNSNTYYCDGGSAYAGRDAIGRYSFPARGQNVHWWEQGTVRKSVREIYAAMGCSEDNKVCGCVKQQVNNIPGFLKAFGVNEDGLLDDNITDTVVV